MPLFDNQVAIRTEQHPGGYRHPRSADSGDFIDHFDPNAESPGRMTRSDNFKFFRRPFLAQPFGRKSSWQPCVLVNRGETTNERGERVPIRRMARIVDLLNEGRPDLPLWTLNATTLRKEDWQEIDKKVLLAQRYVLKLWDLLKSISTYGGLNYYGKMTLEYQAMSDPGEAVMDLDGMTTSRGDAPQFTLRSMPLPLTHCDFFYSDRILEVSRNSGEGLDALSAEAATQRVAEMIEDVAIGNVTGVTYGTIASGNYAAHEGNSTVWGLTNFTYRNTKTNLTVPTGSNPNSTVADVLDMVQTLVDAKYPGPYSLIFSQAWVEFLGNDYSFINGTNWAADPSQTLRQRIEAIEEIADVTVIPRFNETVNTAMTSNLKYAAVMFQKTENVVQAVEGQAPTTLMWETQGGMRKNFKVWAGCAPRLRAEYNQETGILHATTS